MKVYNRIDRKFEEAKDSNLFLHQGIRVLHAMPTCGKTVLSASVSGRYAEWLDTDVMWHAITGSWANVDEIRRLAADGNQFMRELDKNLSKAVCLLTELIREQTGCKVITNMFNLPIDITFGREPDLIRKIFTDRFIAKHPNMSDRDSARLKRNLQQIEAWFEGWKKWVDDHEGVEAYILEEGEYLCSIFGVTPIVANNDQALSPHFDGPREKKIIDDAVYRHAVQVFDLLDPKSEIARPEIVKSKTLNSAANGKEKKV
jgi:hypothetical protein